MKQVCTRSVTTCLLAALAVACSGEAPTSDAGEPSVELHASALPDAPEHRRGHGTTGQVTLPGMDGNPRVWTYELINGVAYAEGDIELGTLEELEEMQKGVVRTDRKWPKRTLVFTFHSSLTDAQEESILAALQHWREKTGLLTRLKTASDTDYVEFTYPTGYDGCASTDIGKKGGKQQVKLKPRAGGEGCTTGNIIHEIGHVLGFEHEHTRADRDDYINYYEDRVLEDKRHNFEIHDASYHSDYYTLDFTSIMMYSSYAFAADEDGDACNSGDAGCEAPMEKLDGTTWTAQRTALSATDIKTFRKLYPTFEPPKVGTYQIYSNSASRHQFCKDNGYAASESYVQTMVSGAILASWDSANSKWNYVADSVPPIEDLPSVSKITCKF